MPKEVIIIGASGHGKVIADIIRKAGDIVYGFLDDDANKKSILGPIDECHRYNEKYFVVAIGDNNIRAKIVNKYTDLKYYTAVHPSAIISDDVVIGEGSAVMANAVINASARIGRHCIINSSSVIEHDNELGDYVHISPNATLCGNVKVGDRTHIGAGATVRNNLNICNDVVIGCGACVVKDIKHKGCYAGVPARSLKSEDISLSQ